MMRIQLRKTGEERKRREDENKLRIRKEEQNVKKADEENNIFICIVYMSINDKLFNIQHNLFNLFLFTTYFLIIIIYLGLSTSASSYLYTIEYYMRIYICLFLIWRFNPFRKIEFTELDRKIVFSAGLFILTTTALNQYVIKLTDSLSTNVSKIANHNN